MPELMIKLENLTKKFGSLTAVDGISMELNKGDVLGFLGPNGAGKSTTMKLIAGFLTPTSGKALVAGHDVVAEPKRIKELIGYLPEGAPMYGNMTVRGFLDFIAQARGFDGEAKSKKIDEIAETVVIKDVLFQTVDTLSKGYKRRVGLAQAMLHDPDILILDEPTDGLDPNQKHQVRKLIDNMAENKAIIVSTHILEEVEACCSRAVIISRGKMVADSTAEELQSRLAYHNSVVLKMPAKSIKRLKTDIEKMSDVKTVETDEADEEKAVMRIIPKKGKIIMPDIAELLKNRKIAIEEMAVEKGKLDDIFREITSEKGER